MRDPSSKIYVEEGGVIPVGDYGRKPETLSLRPKQQCREGKRMADCLKLFDLIMLLLTVLCTQK